MVPYAQTLAEWSRIYVRYIGVYRKLEDSFDQVVQLSSLLLIFLLKYGCISIDVNGSPLHLSCLFNHQNMIFLFLFDIVFKLILCIMKGNDYQQWIAARYESRFVSYKLLSRVSPCSNQGVKPFLQKMGSIKKSSKLSLRGTKLI